MADAVLPAALWDALRQLAYCDGERVSILSAVVHAKHLVEHDERLERARAVHVDADRKLGDLKARRRQIESTIEDAKARKLRAEDRLSSGKLQTEREIEAAQHEIATLESLITDAETTWLETSDAEESAQSAVAASLAALQSEEADAAVRRAKAQKDVQNAEERLAAVDASRREAARQLPPVLRDKYRQLYPSTGGHPFATARAGECSHCHRSVPGEAMQMLRMGTGVPSCPSCARLLLPA